jgi:hypothetical protein
VLDTAGTEAVTGRCPYDEGDAALAKRYPRLTARFR